MKKLIIIAGILVAALSVALVQAYLLPFMSPQPGNTGWVHQNMMMSGGYRYGGMHGGYGNGGSMMGGWGNGGSMMGGYGYGGMHGGYGNGGSMMGGWYR
jgi:hypothetical protein